MRTNAAGCKAGKGERQTASVPECAAFSALNGHLGRAGHTKPSSAFLAASQRASRMALSRGVIGITRRAAAVLPSVTSSVPFRPFVHVTFSLEACGTHRGGARIVERGGHVRQQGRGAAKITSKLFLTDDPLTTLFASKHLYFRRPIRKVPFNCQSVTRRNTRSSLLIVPTSSPGDWRLVA